MTIDPKAYSKLREASEAFNEIWQKTEDVVAQLHAAQRIVLDAENAIKKAESGEKVFHGLRLGELCDKLELLDPEARVMFDFCDCFPLANVGSYRGYYEDLAIRWSSFEPGKREPVKVSQIHDTLKIAIGNTYVGWKGGEFTMGKDSRVWVANSGDCHGTQIVEVKAAGSTIYFRTWMT